MYLSLLLAALLLAPAAVSAAGSAPNPKVCNDSTSPPKDRITQGGCIAIARAKGNCQACHYFPGVTAFGNIAPPLNGMTQRFPDRSRLNAQLYDPAKFNPNTVMPPYGKHEILTPDEIDKLIEWLMTL